MSSHHEALQYPGHLEAAAIPEAGRTLGDVEAVEISTEFVDNAPDGYLAFGDQNIPYKSNLGIRVGGPETFVDMEVITIPDSTGNYDNGRAFIRSLDPDHVSSVPVPLSTSLEGSVPIGRGSEAFNDLPDTVSRKHVMVNSDAPRKILLRNMDPTNQTILFNTARTKTAETPPASAPEQPWEMAATRAIDPRTGESVKGPTVLAHAPDVRVDAASGFLVASETSAAADAAEARRQYMIRYQQHEEQQAALRARTMKPRR